jgi:cytoplasmic iron level regulating protein YaaA (DUF328/UPF0246 family)
MLIVISPAKTLDFESPPVTRKSTQPELLDHSGELMGVLRDLSPEQLSALMSISPALGELNWQRNQEWAPPFTGANARQAVLAFRGDVYVGLDADSFGADDFAFAQQHLRILSGLYGLLRPLDLIQPYRLEMGTALANPRGRNLYEFWGELITQQINKALKRAGGPLVNLASNEYFKAVRPQALAADVVTPSFKERRNGAYKIVSFSAKKARGLMSSWIIRQRLQDVTDLQRFDVEGYTFNQQLSRGNDWVFTREQPG